MPKIPIKDFSSSRTIQAILKLMFCYPDANLAQSAMALTTAKACADQGQPINNSIATQLIFAPSYEALPAELKPKAQNGSIAGDMLKHLYAIDREGEQPSIYKAILEVKASYDGAKEENKEKGLAWSDKPLKDAWRQYKPVSPLWAALRTMEEPWEEIWTSEELTLSFLTRSEIFARFGENTFLHNKKTQRRQPIFTENEVWRIPEALRKHLPASDLIPPAE